MIGRVVAMNVVDNKVQSYRMIAVVGAGNW